MIIATVGFQQFRVDSLKDAVDLRRIFSRARAVAPVHLSHRSQALFLTGENLLTLEAIPLADLLSQDASTEIIRKRLERAEHEFNELTRTQ